MQVQSQAAPGKTSSERAPYSWEKNPLPHCPFSDPGKSLIFRASENKTGRSKPPEIYSELLRTLKIQELSLTPLEKWEVERSPKYWTCRNEKLAEPKLNRLDQKKNLRETDVTRAPLVQSQFCFWQELLLSGSRGLVLPH